jgi:pimeloyl-ACP methyl ester carboxylesterase
LGKNNFKLGVIIMECKIKNLSINYEIIGNGKPVVMLHGYYVDHRLMAGCMEPIFSDKEGYKRIYIDLPGMGKSEGAEWIKSSDDMLDIVISFIEKIIPNENFLLAGQSYGGYLARGVIEKMPTRVEGTLLICPVIIPVYEKRSVEEHAVLVKDEEFLSKLTPEEAEDFNLVVQNERTYERTKNEYCGFEIADDTFLQNLQQNGYGFSFDVDKVNKKIDKPTLILLGKQDGCVGYKDAWSILKNFPRATFAVLDRAGHCLQLEQENLFNSLINDWLIRVNES